MKIRMIFCDGVAVCGGIEESPVMDGIEDINATEQERAAISRYRIEETLRKLSKWIEFEEQVTIEFDLDAMTARVVEAE